MLRRAAANALQRACSLAQQPLSSGAAAGVPAAAGCLWKGQQPWCWRSLWTCIQGHKVPSHAFNSRSNSSSSSLKGWAAHQPCSSTSSSRRSFATKIEREAKSNPGLKFWRPTSPGQRFRVTIRRTGIWKGGPMRCLSRGEKKHGGRNSHGRITCRHRGGGHRKKLRMVDFKRQTAAPGVVERLEYDPGRTGYIALVKYPEGSVKGQQHPYSYVLAPQELQPGDTVQSGSDAPIKPGNTLPLRDIPVGMPIHNIELVPLKGGQICRAAGCMASIVNKQETHAIVRLPSGEQRLISLRCHATIGAMSNPQNKSRVIGKAGYNRWRGIRPTVRGVAMNPVDHPHGGSTAGGRPSCSPWGLPAKGGYKTRDKHKPSSKFILVPRPKKRRV